MWGGGGGGIVIITNTIINHHYNTITITKTIAIVTVTPLTDPIHPAQAAAASCSIATHLCGQDPVGRQVEPPVAPLDKVVQDELAGRPDVPGAAAAWS